MSECKWDPSRHGGKPCPKHGGGETGESNRSGHKVRINKGKYQVKLKDADDFEEVSEEEYNELREGAQDAFDETNDDDFGFDEESETFGSEKLIRKRPDGQWEVSIGDNEWEEVSEEEYNELREGGYEEIDYEEESEDKEGENGEEQKNGEYIPLPEYKSGPNGSIIVTEGPLKDKNFDSTSDLLDYIKKQQNNNSEADKKYEDYKKKGLTTWNQKLNKGDRVSFKDKDGNDAEGYINGFWYKGELQDSDTYEEGKDNLWHDFRSVELVDRNGKRLGNINANQILKHSRNNTWSNEELDEAIDKHDLMNLTPEFRDALLKRLRERLKGK